MSPTLTYTRMITCGRCNAQIAEGCFCQPCLSFFARFAHTSSPIEPPPARLPLAVSVTESRRSFRTFRVRPQWLQFTMIDRAIRVVVESNDPACLSQFLSVAASYESPYACAGEFRYAIEARDSHYLVRAGRRNLGVAPSRAEAIRRLQFDLHSRIAQSAMGGAGRRRLGGALRQLSF